MSSVCVESQSRSQSPHYEDFEPSDLIKERSWLLIRCDKFSKYHKNFFSLQWRTKFNVTLLVHYVNFTVSERHMNIKLLRSTVRQFVDYFEPLMWIFKWCDKSICFRNDLLPAIKIKDFFLRISTFGLHYLTTMNVRNLHDSSKVLFVDMLSCICCTQTASHLPVEICVRFLCGFLVGQMLSMKILISNLLVWINKCRDKSIFWLAAKLQSWHLNGFIPTK